jgi:2-octaprenyl-6-methoxyphenol hydroxylase
LLIAPSPAAADRRTTALLDGSIQILKALHVWPLLIDAAAPLKFLRLVDGTKRILRAPEVLFDSAELGLEAFGYNVENEQLREILLAACKRMPQLRVIDALVVTVKPAENGVTLTLPDHEERVRLVAAADGRKSICRSAALIETRSRQLPQTAVVLNLKHSAPHHDTSTEFHTESGPFTLAPLKGNRSSLVCVVRPEETEAIGALNDAEFGREVERRAHSILGTMEVETARGIFPLSTMLADHFAARRIALIGEAAHVLPPIGAQGLNLGIRDAAVLAELVADARAYSVDPGGDEVLDEYNERRRGDVRSRTFVVDFANRSLMSDFLPVHAARGLGLHLASRVGFFRRALMRQGLGQSSDSLGLARREL